MSSMSHLMTAGVRSMLIAQTRRKHEYVMGTALDVSPWAIYP